MFVFTFNSLKSPFILQVDHLHAESLNCMMRVQLTSQERQFGEEELRQTYWIKIVFKHSIKHMKYNVFLVQKFGN